MLDPNMAARLGFFLAIWALGAMGAAPRGAQLSKKAGRAMCGENGQLCEERSIFVWPTDHSYYDIHGAMRRLPNCNVKTEWCWAADHERPRIFDLFKEISTAFPPMKLLKYYYRAKMRGSSPVEGFHLYAKYVTTTEENMTDGRGVIHGLLFFPWSPNPKEYPKGLSFEKWEWTKGSRDKENERPWP